MRRRIVWLVAALMAVAAVAVAGCGDSNSSSSSGSSGGSSSGTITIASNNPNWGTQMQFVLAQELGYFKDVGIDNIKIVTTDNFVQGLVGGSVDIAQGDTDLFLNAAYKSNQPVTIVACDFRSESWELGGGKGITSAKDLEGKTATPGNQGGRNEYIMKLIFEKLGVDPSKVKTVYMGGGSDARLQGLLNGQVAGAMIQPRHEAPLAAAGGKVLYHKEVSIPQDVFAVRGDWLKDNHATLEAFMTAMIKASQYIEHASKSNGHIQKIVDIMKSRKYEVTPDSVADFHTFQIHQSPTYGFKPSGMDQLVQQEQAINLMPKDMDWRKFVDLSDLYKAQQSLGYKQNPDPALVKAGS